MPPSGKHRSLVYREANHQMYHFVNMSYKLSAIFLINRIISGYYRAQLVGNDGYDVRLTCDRECRVIDEREHAVIDGEQCLLNGSLPVLGLGCANTTTFHTARCQHFLPLCTIAVLLKDSSFSDFGEPKSGAKEFL